MIFESIYNPVENKPEITEEEAGSYAPLPESESLVPVESPGLFDGISETWKAPISGAIKTTAAFETGLAETNVVGSALQMYETETGEAIDNPEEREKQIISRLEQEASEHRELAQKEYGLDPETSGIAAQMVFGLAESLPKAVGYSVLGGPVGGAVGFGTDIGLTTYGELRDKGVDKGTAAVAGLTSGALNAAGVWLPATFGKSRVASATIGALANLGLTGAELAGVGVALSSQGYEDLADQYGLNWTALATSALFGGAFGGVMYRGAKSSPGNAEVGEIVKVSADDVAAARVVAGERITENKLQKIIDKAASGQALSAEEAATFDKLAKALRIAERQMGNGKAVDVSDAVGDVEIDKAVMKESRGNFAREYLMGGDDSQAVVLQNRDRDTVASVAQMNRIAAKPDYQLTSFSRMLQDGAPIVSFGTMPDNAHLGVGDLVVGPGGRRIPVQYAVVEADSVLTSNDYLGNANPSYGDASQVNAVAGNGRATGIAEAYNRGTAEQYKADMIADKQHGIDPEVIKAMKKPMLVRFIGKNEVTTKLIEESNKQSTLARSPVELAVDDAKLISRNVDSYEFDEDGLPTEATVRQFVNDINEPNALGRLITRDGNVTPEAVARVQNAVVQAAYGDLAFSELVAMETKPGAKRLMNALVKAAPRFVEIRKTIGESYDFSRQLLEGYKQVRESMQAGQESVLQSGSIFGDNSASAFVDMLDRNRNSMAGVMRELEPIFEAIKQAKETSGGMFGGEMMDLPEILSRVRQAQNEARLAEGKPLLMDIDAEEMRQSFKAAQELIDSAKELSAKVEDARAREESVLEDTVTTETKRETARSILSEDGQQVMLRNVANENPGLRFKVSDENGNPIDVNIEELEAIQASLLDEADVDEAAIGKAVECILNNEGI